MSFYYTLFLLKNKCMRANSMCQVVLGENFHPASSLYSWQFPKSIMRPSAPVAPLRCCSAHPRQSCRAALPHALLLCFFERRSHRPLEIVTGLMGIFFSRGQRFPQVAVLDLRQYPRHGCAALVAPCTPLLFHPVTVQPVVALACAETSTATRKPPLLRRLQIIPIPFQIPAQAGNVFRLHLALRHAFQCVQAGLRFFFVMRPHRLPQFSQSPGHRGMQEACQYGKDGRK